MGISFKGKRLAMVYWVSLIMEKTVETIKYNNIVMGNSVLG